MTREEPELLTDIRDFTTQFYVILRRVSSEWLQSSIESDQDMRLQYGALTYPSTIFSFSSVRTDY